MTMDLLPCPFCGSRRVVFGKYARYVECANCGSSGPGDRRELSTDEVVALWNRRVGPAEEAEERGRIAERIRIANAANEMGLGYPSMKAGAALLAFAERIRTGQV